MNTPQIGHLRPMEPREYFFKEHPLTFNKAFDLLRFEPTPKGFTLLAESYSERALRQGIALHPFWTAMFLIDWWMEKEMSA